MSVLEGIGGLILAGGKSRRMGRDKASLIYKGRPLIDHMTSMLSDAGADPVLIAGQMGTVKDVVTDGGPVAAICGLAETALENGLPATWLIVPVDMPFLSASALNHLRETPGPAVYFVSNPLPLLLHLSAQTVPFIEAAKRDLQAGRSVSVHRLLSALGACSVIPGTAIAPEIININTPEEWQAVQGEKLQ